MIFNIITIFPEILDSYLNESILKRAREEGKIAINMINLRDYADNKWKKTDDEPYGGGAGMIMTIEPLYKAIQDIKQKSQSKNHKIFLMSPKGEQFTQRAAEGLKENLDEITLICGRYEGFDARIDEFVDGKLSIGNFVLCGGEIPALAITEAVSRLIPGVLGDDFSSVEETFSKNLEYIEYPQYTRPETFSYSDTSGKTQELSVPEVLLSGNHAKIEEWRKKHSKNGTDK